MKTLTPLAYLAGGVALWKLIHWLFEQSEKQLAADTKDSIALWLLEASPSARVKNWPETFGEMFDGLFTKKHLSWKCFRMSCLASLTAVALVTVAFPVIRPDIFRFWLIEGRTSWTSMAVSALSFNLLADYVSLLETRFILRKMAETFKAVRAAQLLAVDFLLTGLVFWLFSPLGYVIYYIHNERLRHHGVTLEALQHAFSSGIEDWIGFPTIVGGLLSFDYAMSVFFWSTFFTSFWVWIYALSAFTVQAAEGVTILRSAFDVENKPLSTMGFVGGGLCACVWWGLCLVSWLAS